MIINWASAAARKIADLWPAPEHGRGDGYLTDEQRSNIADHVAQLIVANGPRCDECKHWQPLGESKIGDCAKIVDSELILDLPADFGCIRWETR